MVGRILDRRALRAEADQAAQSQAQTPAAPKARKTRAKKAPPRLRARWGVFDAGMKQIALFDYNQRGAADEKLAALRAKNKGIYFLQVVKEPMPEPAPGAAPTGE
jgi:hypothetical protein